MEMKPYIVYVKVDDSNRITAINSSAFITDTTGWVQIDSGYGDRFHHAQSNYFTLPICDDRGVYRYRMSDGHPVERNNEEMDADYVPQEEGPTTEERVDALEATTDDIILMMAEMIGG